MPRIDGFMLIGIGILAVIGIAAPPSYAADAAEETAKAERIIGPDGSDNACSNCHVREIEAWKQTRHFSTFVDRHRSERAKEIQANLGRAGAKASMKRSKDCRQCHYTSQIANGRLRPRWGVSCESCHGAGRDWNNIHNKLGGDAAGKTMRWGEGRKEDAAGREARLTAAAGKGMIHSEMLYEIATNCFGCHTVPNESLVNNGKHRAGSDFDLVMWSQGEVRHNYLSSPGAPDSPTNRAATQKEKRTRYVIGAMVDLEFTLRNLANVAEKGGAFHTAMVERANRARAKVDAILKAVAIPDLSAAVKAVPSPVTEGTAIGSDLAESIGRASRAFAGNRPDLSAIDPQIPTGAKGNAAK
ncbi:MAG: multiheme c-type cytochrome, partial [Acidobacteriota bacterium]